MASPSSKITEGSPTKRPAEDDAKEEKRQKISFGLSSKPLAVKNVPGKFGGGLQIKLNALKKPGVKPAMTRAAVFNDDEEEPVEMPREAKMLMRNIGRDTPTSAGPNSFGKTKQGFCNAKKVFEKTLNETADNISEDAPK